MSDTSDVLFKFKFIRNGQPTGLVAKEGRATWEGLVLDGEHLSYDGIEHATVFDKRLALSLTGRGPTPPNLGGWVIDGDILALALSNAQARQVKERISHASSARVLKRRKLQLTQEGKADRFRSTRCPRCESQIDLSELEASRYIYCRYCESIFTPKNQVVAAGESYRVCADCGFFGRIRNYMEFYFYFLLVFFRFVIKDRYLCDGCAVRLWRRMLFRNFLSIVGIPAAFIVRIKSMMGGDPKMKGLAQANRLASAAKAREASTAYQVLHQQYPDHPGLLFNEGMGHSRVKDQAQASACFARALKSCPNYLPALAMARAPQGQKLGT